MRHKFSKWPYAEPKYTAISVLLFLLPLGRCLSGGLLVPEGIHQPSSPVFRYWPEKNDIILKTYNTYKESYKCI